MDVQVIGGIGGWSTVLSTARCPLHTGEWTHTSNRAHITHITTHIAQLSQLDCLDWCCFYVSAAWSPLPGVEWTCTHWLQNSLLILPDIVSGHHNWALLFDASLVLLQLGALSSMEKWQKPDQHRTYYPYYNTQCLVITVERYCLMFLSCLYSLVPSPQCRIDTTLMDTS